MTNQNWIKIAKPQLLEPAAPPSRKHTQVFAWLLWSPDSESSRKTAPLLQQEHAQWPDHNT